MVKAKIIVVNDKMQQNYRYELVAPMGKAFDARFLPELTPAEMLKLGVFGGRYLRDCVNEFPSSWFSKARFYPLGLAGHDPELNFFMVDASLPLQAWIEKGWIYPDDPRGWFQWYCRYYMGRRIPEEDERQIHRWLMMKRHIAQIKKHCAKGDLHCRRKQRQALLHWAYDSRLM